MGADEEFEGRALAVLEVALAEHPGALLEDYFHRTDAIFHHLDIISKQYYKHHQHVQEILLRFLSFPLW